MRISPKAQTLKLYREGRKGAKEQKSFQRQGRETAKEQKSLNAKAARTPRNPSKSQGF
jgi:hypothetical protein